MTNELTTEALDYRANGFTQEEEMKLRIISERLKVRVQRTAEEMLSMGADLQEAKVVVRDNGDKFTLWCESNECPVGYQTAVRLISVHKRLGGKNTPGVFFQQGIRVLSEVTMTTDEDLRGALLEHVEKESEAGHKVTRKEIAALKKALAEEKARAEAAEDNSFNLNQRLAEMTSHAKTLAEKKEQFAEDLIAGDAKHRELQAALKQEREARQQELEDAREVYQEQLSEMRREIREEERKRPKTSKEEEAQRKRLRELEDVRDTVTTDLNKAKADLKEVKKALEDDSKAINIRKKALDRFSKAVFTIEGDALAIVGAADLLKQIPITDELYEQIQATKGLLRRAIEALEESTSVNV